jgi:hypothetical protein
MAKLAGNEDSNPTRVRSGCRKMHEGTSRAHGQPQQSLHAWYAVATKDADALDCSNVSVKTGQLCRECGCC